MNRRDLAADLLAGITVALVGLPQCLAYATMSGLPPAYGLSTAVVPGIVAAAVGRSQYVVTGPTNTTGLLVLGALLPYLGSNGLLRPDGLAWLATLTLLCGVLRLGFAFAGGTALVRFVPESVLGGFMIGVGVLIAVMQLDEALGLPPVTASGLWSESQGLAALLGAGARPSLTAVAMTFGCIAFVIVLRRLRRAIPGALLAIIAASGISWLFALDQANGLPLVGDRTPVPNGWPTGGVPVTEAAVLGSLFLPAAAIVLLGTLELLVSARADASRSGLRREIIAQAAANVAGAFASAFPASASLTRSALLRLTEPHSRLGAVFAAAITAPMLFAGGALIARIPQAALAGVLFITAAAMVRQPTLGRVWGASPVSRLLLVTTAVSTLVLPLHWAVFVGVGLSLVIHLVRTSTPRVRVLTIRGDQLAPLDVNESPTVAVLEISGTVHYAAAEPMLDEIDRLLPRDATAVIVDLSHAHELRFTGLRALEAWANGLQHRGVRVRLAGVTPEVRDLLVGAGSHLAFSMWDPVPGRSAMACYRDMTR